MRDLTNRQVRLRRRPAGLPSPEDFELTEEAAPVPGAGQVLVRTLLLSIDPAMRGWVAEGPNYVQAVPVGGVMRSFGLAEVARHQQAIEFFLFCIVPSPARIEPNQNGDGHVER